MTQNMTLSGEELFYLRGLLNTGDPVNGYAARLAEARGDFPGVDRPTLSQVFLRILEQERQDLPRWGVDYSDLATKIDGMTEAALRDLYDDLRGLQFDVRCHQPAFSAFAAAITATV